MYASSHGLSVGLGCLRAIAPFLFLVGLLTLNHITEHFSTPVKKFLGGVLLAWQRLFTTATLFLLARAIILCANVRLDRHTLREITHAIPPRDFSPPSSPHSRAGR